MTLSHRRRHGAHPRYAAFLAAAASATALAVTATPAAAQGEPLPDDNAGTGQYIEPVPEAEGDRRADSGGGGNRGGGGGGLPPGVRDDLPPGREGAFLERLAATAAGSATGAGDESGSSGRDDKRDGGSSGDGRAATPAEDEPSVASALSSTLFDSGSAAIPLLVLGLAGLTAAAALMRLRGRRGGV